MLWVLAFSALSPSVALAVPLSERPETVPVEQSSGPATESLPCLEWREKALRARRGAWIPQFDAGVVAQAEPQPSTGTDRTRTRTRVGLSFDLENFSQARTLQQLAERVCAPGGGSAAQMLQDLEALNRGADQIAALAALRVLRVAVRGYEELESILVRRAGLGIDSAPARDAFLLFLTDLQVRLREREAAAGLLFASTEPPEVELQLNRLTESVRQQWFALLGRLGVKASDLQTNPSAPRSTDTASGGTRSQEEAVRSGVQQVIADEWRTRELILLQSFEPWWSLRVAGGYERLSPSDESPAVPAYALAEVRIDLAALQSDGPLSSAVRRQQLDARRSGGGEDAVAQALAHGVLDLFSRRAAWEQSLALVGRRLAQVSRSDKAEADKQGSGEPVGRRPAPPVGERTSWSADRARIDLEILQDELSARVRALPAVEPERVLTEPGTSLETEATPTQQNDGAGQGAEGLRTPSVAGKSSAGRQVQEGQLPSANEQAGVVGRAGAGEDSWHKGRQLLQRSASDVVPGRNTPTSGDVYELEASLRDPVPGRSAGPALRYFTESPAMRMRSLRDSADTVGLRFRYLGDSSDKKNLGSGVNRRQFGVFLRGQDQCNLLYVMLRLDGRRSAVSVQGKTNPGSSRHEECGNRGYRTVPPEWSSQVDLAVADGQVDELEARILTRTGGVPETPGGALRGNPGEILVVSLDGRTVWRGKVPRSFQKRAVSALVGTLGSDGEALRSAALEPSSTPPPATEQKPLEPTPSPGIVGARSDNVSIEFDLYGVRP